MDKNKKLLTAAENGNLEEVRLALSEGANIDTQDKNKNTPLHKAAWHGHTDIAQVLIEHGANLKATNRVDNEPIHMAADGGHTDIVNLLIKHGSNLNVIGQDGGTPLHFASQRGHVDTIRYLISQGADTTIKNKRGHTPMDKVKAHDPNRDEIIKFFDEKDETDETDRKNKKLLTAAENGNLEEVRLALSEGANVDTQDKNKNTPLHEAAWRGYTDIAQVLIEHGASLRATNTVNNEPIHMAADGGHTDIVILLLNYGIDLNVIGQEGRAPLHFASRNGHVDTIRYLISQGADTTIKDKYSNTPMEKIKSYDPNRDEIIKLFDEKELQEQHKQNETVESDESDEFDSEDKSLLEAIRSGDLDGVKSAIEKGADLNILDSDCCNMTPLHLAAYKGHFEIVRLLYEQHGADIMCTDSVGDTPLHDVCRDGYTDIIRFLLSKKPNITVRNNSGKTPLEELKSGIDGRDEIVKLFSDLQTQDTHKSDATLNLVVTPETPEDDIVPFLEKPVNENENLLTSVKLGDINGVKFALDNGADVDIVDVDNIDKWTPLCYAVDKGNAEMVLLLLQAGASPRVETTHKEIPLHGAAYRGNIEIAKLLLKFGCNPNTVEKRGNTPIHYACKEGHVNIIHYLLTQNVNTTIKNNEDKTPVDCVAHDNVNRVDILKLFTDQNLHIAAENGKVHEVKAALDKGADVNSHDYNQQTPLHLAALKGHTKIVKLLSEHNADLNSIDDKDGSSPLHLACRGGHLETTGYLISKGANTIIKDKSGRTPVDEIKHHATNRDEMLELFTGKYNPKQTTEWKINNIDEELVLEKPDYGVKLVIPPSAVEEGQNVKTEVEIVTPPENDMKLPPDVEPVSCFYKIETTGKFSQPIKLHLQHNVEVKSEDESKQLAFVRAKGPPPYKFELLPESTQPKFKVNDNSGEVQVSDFSLLGIVWRKLKGIIQPSYSYTMTLYYMLVMSSLQVKVVISRNLGPHLEKIKKDDCFKGWARREPISFYFNPEKNAVTMSVINEFYDIKPMKSCKIKKKDIDQSQPTSPLHLLHFKVEPKHNNSKALGDLKLTFEGTRDEQFIVISREELQQFQLGLPISYITSASEEILEKVPKKKDLLSLLNPIEYMWDVIGELLGVRYGKIKSSQYEETYNTRRLSDVLQSWIDGKPSEVSWKMVITVVEKPPVENKVVAEAITHFLSRPDTQSRYCSFNQSESEGLNFITFGNQVKSAPVSTSTVKTNEDSLEQSEKLKKESEVRPKDVIEDKGDTTPHTKHEDSLEQSEKLKKESEALPTVGPEDVIEDNKDTTVNTKQMEKPEPQKMELTSTTNDQTMLTSLKSELQDLREQVQALKKVVTEQQEETQSLLHKLIQSSTLNISSSSNDKAKTEMVPFSSANDLTSSTVSNSKSAIICGPNKDSAYTTMTVTMNEGSIVMTEQSTCTSSMEIRSLDKELKAFEIIMEQNKTPVHQPAFDIKMKDEVISHVSTPTITLMIKFNTHTRDTCYSPPFTTHTNGYVIGFSVDTIQIGGRFSRGLRLQCYILPGPHDDTLMWPFKGLVMIKLLNQLDESRECYIYSFEYNECDEEGQRVMSKEEAKPKQSLSSYLNLSELKKNSQRNCQYLYNDHLKFSVTTVLYEV